MLQIYNTYHEFLTRNRVFPLLPSVSNGVIRNQFSTHSLKLTNFSTLQMKEIIWKVEKGEGIIVFGVQESNFDRNAHLQFIK